jgi:hypothetical protein
VENGALVAIAETTNQQTIQQFSDGEVRVKFELNEGEHLSLCVRQGGEGGYYVTWAGSRSVAPLVGKPHELVFTCAGENVAATLDGQPLVVNPSGQPKRGCLQIKSRKAALRILSLNTRYLSCASAAFEREL